MITRMEGVTFLHELQPGESCLVYDNGLLVVHPERPAFRVWVQDGKVHREEFVLDYSVIIDYSYTDNRFYYTPNRSVQ